MGGASCWRHMLRGALVTAFRCLIGHDLHDGNTGWVAGEAYCLDCVALAHRAESDSIRLMVEVMLNLAPFPTRERLGAA